MEARGTVIKGEMLALQNLLNQTFTTADPIMQNTLGITTEKLVTILDLPEQEEDCHEGKLHCK